MVKSFLTVFLASSLAVFCLVPHTANTFTMGLDLSEPISSQQSPELVTRDEQGIVTYHLSDAPPPRSDTKPLANPPGYDVIIEDGFPVQTLHTGGSFHAGSAIHTLVGDVDGDGFQEIVVTGLASGPLYMFNYQGHQVPGWPQSLGGAAYAVMQKGLIIAANFGDNIIAYDHNGYVLWQTKAENYVATPPSISYVHSLESWGVFLEEEDNDVHGYRVADGTVLPGWPARVGGGQECHTPAIADIDDDGENECISASGSSSSGVTVAAFKEDGSLVSGWPIPLFQGGPDTFPVIGDVDGDGEKEIIIIRKAPNSNYVDVYAPDGILKRTWQLSGDLSYGTAPALADIDDDGIPEIIVQTDTAIDVTDGFGTSLPGWPLFYTRWKGNSAPVVGDVDGDGDVEIVFTSNADYGFVHVVNSDGTYVTNFPMPLSIEDGAVPAIADIDLDNHNEIIITGSYWTGYTGYYDKVWVFDLDRDNPSAQHGRIEWGQFGGNMRHTNAYKGNQSDLGCFCVSNETELQDALAEAASNGANDVIKVVQGNYYGNFVYSSSEGNSITLRGGYAPGCVNRMPNPENTVLDGGNTSHVLELTSSAGGAITVDGFTIQHGGNVSYGGGVFAQSSATSGTAGTVTITNNIVTENSVTASGGGVYAVSESTSGTAGTVTVENNVIFGNSAPNQYAGGVYAESFSSSGTAGTVSFTNNTITGNNAQNGGGVLLSIGNAGGAISAYNNIIWGNTATTAPSAPDSGDDIYLNKGTGVANSYNNDYLDIYGDPWDSEDGRITADPLFVGGGDYHLQPISPCIDVGTNSAPDLLSTDFEGDPRIMDGNRDGDAVVDIGADECHRLWYVDGDTGASGDGTSWPEAFKTIGEALDAASDGDEMWVKQGTYPLAAQLTVDKAVNIYGGFVGTETVRNQRDWVNNTTTVHGKNMVRCFFVTADAVINGFTIINGNASSDNGGGMKISYASPIITNCNFFGNEGDYGGGILVGYSYPIIANCTFKGNTAQFEGGGIRNWVSFPTITNCTFTGNYAHNDVLGGGAIYNTDSSPTITNCSFTLNITFGNGGGIYNGDSCPTITNCTFTKNIANGSYGGGAIYNKNSSPSITNSTFTGNTANGNGGGIHNDNASYNENSLPIITNCILWGDIATTGLEIYNALNSSPTVTYCDVQGGYAGMGNIDNDPLFVDVSDPYPVNWNLHLQENSPCIDHGTASAPNLPTTDFEGDLRVIGSAPDMGADEFAGYTSPCDYDADGLTDIGVYRPSTGAWYLNRSTLGSQTVYWGGDANDVPTPEDYNGDGATDITVYRSSTGWWYIKDMGNFLFGGLPGDIPVPGDYTGNGAIDLGVYRSSTGWWYIKDVGTYLFGGLADDIPVPGDYDGDGITDIALFRPSTGWWYVKDVGSYLHGASGDFPVPGDYDGDGTTDVAVYRSSTGWWYIKGVGNYLYGQSGDVPVPGDYDGDGTIDIAVFRPSNGRWYIKGASTFPIWGQSGDTPLTRNVWIWQETGLLP